MGEPGHHAGRQVTHASLVQFTAIMCHHATTGSPVMSSALHADQQMKPQTDTQNCMCCSLTSLSLLVITSMRTYLRNHRRCGCCLLSMRLLA